MFDSAAQHHYQFKAIGNQQVTEAIFLTLEPECSGDSVLPFIVGLQTILLKAHCEKLTSTFSDNIDPQHIYNVARNIKIAV